MELRQANEQLSAQQHEAKANMADTQRELLAAINRHKQIEEQREQERSEWKKEVAGLKQQLQERTQQLQDAQQQRTQTEQQRQRIEDLEGQLQRLKGFGLNPLSTQELEKLTMELAEATKRVTEVLIKKHTVRTSLHSFLSFPFFLCSPSASLLLSHFVYLLFIFRMLVYVLFVKMRAKNARCAWYHVVTK